ncbi:MAG: carboxy terminal-processing peptidase [Kofleriaceae bacterium]
MNRVVYLVLVVACSARPASPPPPPVPQHPAPAQVAPAPEPDQRESALSHEVVELLEGRHLLGRKLDDTISSEAFATYLDRLDSGKLFLLAADRDKLAVYRDKIDDELHSGNLELAHLGQAIFLARVAVVEKVVAAALAAPMNHDDDEYVELDPKKVEPATTEAQLAERWRQRLELEVMQRVAAMEQRLHSPAGTGSNAGSNAGSASTPASDIPATPEGRETKVRANLAKSYAAQFSRLKTPGPLDAASELVNAVCQTFDPHTDYLPPADKANFDIAISGSLEGIGAALRVHDDLIEVSDLVPGGAAARQGKLAAGDLIISVQQANSDDWVDVMNMHLDDVVALIRGPKGTVVRLHVRKPDGREEQIDITRDVVVIEAAYAHGAFVQRKAGPTFGYIHLPGFYGDPSSSRTASKDVGRLLDAMNAKHVAGVVLDLRGNGGGLLQDSVTLAGELIDKGPIVQVRNHDGQIRVLDDPTSGTELSAPVVVLVDQFSASASEILAGAMQDYQRAVIVGTGPTHGKGTVQALINLDPDGAKPVLGVLKLTIQQFFRVSGSSTQRDGVTPDITLPNPNSYIKSGERDLEHAIEWTKIDPAPHVDWKATWDRPTLVTKSAKRVAKSAVFAKITAIEAIMAKRRNDTRIPLARSQWDARAKHDKDELDKVALDLDKVPAAFAVTTIDEPTASTPNDDRMKKWRDSVARDPWIEESIAVLGDMTRTK